MLLVCTNAKRDACCALLGRALSGRLAEDAETDPDAVWESDHLGGHRFAPTAVVLPSGYVHGRLDGPAARAVLREAAAGRVDIQHCRGRSTWSRPGQAAELALRAELQEYATDAVLVLGERLLDPVPGDPAHAASEGPGRAGATRCFWRRVTATSAPCSPRPKRPSRAPSPVARPSARPSNCG